VQARSRRLYVARDCLGRRSLLVHRPSADDPRFYVASVLARAGTAGVDEFGTAEVLCIDVGAWGQDGEVRALTPATLSVWLGADRSSGRACSREA
jgi:asparagine synthetase B (glutamine-hydrolysing)